MRVRLVIGAAHEPAADRRRPRAAHQLIRDDEREQRHRLAGARGHFQHAMALLARVVSARSTGTVVARRAARAFASRPRFSSSMYENCSGYRKSYGK